MQENRVIIHLIFWMHLSGHMFGGLQWKSLLKNNVRIFQSCHPCRAHQQMTATVPIDPWENATSLWVRLQLKFAGPFTERMFWYFLILVLNELKHIPCQISKPLQHIKNLEFPFQFMGSLLFLWQIIVLLLLLVMSLNYSN